MKRKILLAPDSFKGSLSSLQVCTVIKSAWGDFFPEDEIYSFPLADGGEGTVEALVKATGGEFKTTSVRGPLGEPVEATWGILGDRGTAVIEMAAASGLSLVSPEKRNPLYTSTFGTGQLIASALEAGCRRVIVGIGGSATNDGGAGMASALGVKLLDGRGKPLAPGGKFLAELERIDMSGLHPRVKEVEFVVACDVDNPLTGVDGASAVYGPQKGATEEMVRELDRALSHYARVIKEVLGVDVEGVPGAGAAGGLGAGLMAFLGAELKPGVSLVLEYSGLAKLMEREKLDLVITGEGEINAQTIRGKVPFGVARLAKKYGLPVIALVGSAAEDYGVVFESGIDAVVDLIPRPMPLEKAMKEAEALLKRATQELARLRRIFAGF